MTEEKKLVQLAAQGNQDAFGRLVTAYEKPIYNLALRMTGNREDAADLTQESFLKAWRALPGFKAEASFSTWLYRLASNTCIDFLRREKRRKTVSLTYSDGEDDGAQELELPDESASPEQLAIETENRETMARAVGELNTDYRQILTLRVVGGLSYEEIADVLELKPGTVKSRLFRAREKLKKELLQIGNKAKGTSSKTAERGEMRELL